MSEINNEELNTVTAEPEEEVPGTEKPAQKKKKKYKVNVLRMAVFIICLGVACFSAVKLIGILKEYKQGADTYSSIEETAFVPPKHDTSDDPDASESLVPDIDFAALKKISDNAVGWLYCPGTVINYPVAKTKDNSYYLYHLLDGTSNSNGCFFVDYRNADGFADQNTIIYGHRMKNGAMLSSITKYNKQEYYDEHPVVYLMTPDGKYELQIFSAYITESTSSAYKRTFDSEAAFADWINNAVKHSYVKTNVEVGPQDHVVTLSTCVKADDTRRFIAIGKMVKLEE